MDRFTGKTVIITGASRGIGMVTALAFAGEGANIVVNYYSSQREAEELVEKIKSVGTQAIAIQCDVSNEDDVKNMIEQTVAGFGHVDILVNNAGTVKDVPILERRVEDWKRTLEVNLIGQFLCIKYAVPRMLEHGGGKIINISSTSAIYNFSPDIVDYDASKAGVIALTKDFAKALAPNITVNAVAPGWVDTDMNKGLPEEFLKKERDGIYIGRFARPDEIAKVILFLGSESANFITGSVIVADGGHD
ncbi:MAG: 3-oxoacyl-ACP reductase family protein [Caldilineaceae bacterium]